MPRYNKSPVGAEPVNSHPVLTMFRERKREEERGRRRRDEAEEGR